MMMMMIDTAEHHELYILCNRRDVDKILVWRIGYSDNLFSYDLQAMIVSWILFRNQTIHKSKT